MREALERLAEALGKRARRDEPLAPHTNMRVGGPADLLVVCSNGDELVEAVQLAIDCGVPWLVLGGGCNVLVADAGVRGLVIINRAAAMRMSDGGLLWAEAGASLSRLAIEMAEAGWAGLEWAAGLPGTVGGAVVGNAGAFGGDMASMLERITVLERDGSTCEQPGTWMAFDYRESRIKRLRAAERPVLLAANLRLGGGDPQVLTTRVAEILEWRRTRHPSGATMGSTFKNAPDAHAGRMIEGAGLKGARVGGVKVSEMHANFLINTGGATAADVLALIEHVQAEVERCLGVRLQLEIELVGAW